jgi:hypothetical protein
MQLAGWTHPQYRKNKPKPEYPHGKEGGLRSISLKQNVACGENVPYHLIAPKNACISMQLRV